MEPTSPAKYVNWAAMLKRNRRAATPDNIRRALQNSTHPQDVAELRALLDERVKSYKAKAKAKEKAKPTPASLADMPPILQLLVSRMPSKPYFADCLDHGTKIRPKDEAVRHREVQLNLPWARQCLVFDLDHGETLDARLPTPNVVVTNPATGHRHALIVWKTPVLVGPQASQKAQKYYTDIATAVGQCWQADPHYSGTLTHNPLHKNWKTEILQPEPYELADFRAALQIVRSMPANHPRMRSSEWAESYAAEGRNCATWEACRWPSYALGTGATFDAVLELVQSFNRMNNSPALGYPECKDIAKSISRYVLSGKRKGHSMTDDDWRGYVDYTHRTEVQSERGKRSGMARRAQSEDKRFLAQGMADQGYKVSAIAKQLEVNRSTVHRWLRF